MTGVYPVCPVCGSSAREGFRFRIGSYDTKGKDRSSTWFECFVCTTRFPLWTYFDAWRPNVVTEDGKLPSNRNLRGGRIYSFVSNIPASDSSDSNSRRVAKATGSS